MTRSPTTSSLVGRVIDKEPLERYHVGLDERTLRERILSELRTFRGPAPQQDDLTLIVLRAV